MQEEYSIVEMRYYEDCWWYDVYRGETRLAEDVLYDDANQVLVDEKIPDDCVVKESDDQGNVYSLRTGSRFYEEMGLARKFDAGEV